MPSTPKTPGSAAAINGGELFQFLDEAHQRMEVELHHINHAMNELAQQDDLQHATRQQLREAIEWFGTIGRDHHLDEERHVFPPLLESGDETVAEVAQRLRQDHGWIEQNWLEIGPLLSAVAEGNHSYDVDSLGEAVQMFTQLCLDHLILEELLAYPEARARIGAASLAVASRELIQRHKARAALAQKQRAA
jgi:hemerythrin-like domain-containing protein